MTSKEQDTLTVSKRNCTIIFFALFAVFAMLVFMNFEAQDEAASHLKARLAVEKEIQKYFDGGAHGKPAASGYDHSYELEQKKLELDREREQEKREIESKIRIRERELDQEREKMKQQKQRGGIGNDEFDEEPRTGLVVASQDCCSCRKKARQNKRDPNYRIKIALMQPITSRGFESGPISKLPPLAVFVPSLLRTMEEGFDYRIYFGYDVRDQIYDVEEKRNIVNQHLKKLIGNKPITWVFIPSYCHTPRSVNTLWNILGGQAYRDGMDYFLPTNDDLELRTPWTSRMVHDLRTKTVYPDFGLAVFNDLSDGFATFHLTSRLHYEIFSAYYPVHFPFAHADPWAFDIYRGFHAAIYYEDITVANRQGLAESKPRYEYGGLEGYNEMVVRWRNHVDKWLREHSEIYRNQPIPYHQAPIFWQV